MKFLGEGLHGFSILVRGAAFRFSIEPRSSNRFPICDSLSSIFDPRFVSYGQQFESGPKTRPESRVALYSIPLVSRGCRLWSREQSNTPALSRGTCSRGGVRMKSSWSGGPE